MGVSRGHGFNAATAGTFAYEDLVEMRQRVKGPMDYLVVHPNDMGDILSDDKFLRADFITTVDRVQPSTTIFQTKLGITIYETEQAEAGRVLGFSSRRAGRFTVKTRSRPQATAASRGCGRAAARQQTQRFNLGAGGGPLQKGVTVWELIDAVVTRGDAVAKCTV